MSVSKEMADWIAKLSLRNDPESQQVTDCMRRALIELERYEGENAQKAHDEMYGRRSSAREEVLFKK